MPESRGVVERRDNPSCILQLRCRVASLAGGRTRRFWRGNSLGSAQRVSADVRNETDGKLHHAVGHYFFVWEKRSEARFLASNHADEIFRYSSPPAVDSRRLSDNVCRAMEVVLSSINSGMIPLRGNFMPFQGCSRGIELIKTFANKQLKALWYAGNSRIDARLHKRIKRRLEILNDAATPEYLNLPGFNFHALRGYKPKRYTVHGASRSNSATATPMRLISRIIITRRQR